MKNHQPYLFKKNDNKFLLLTKGGEPTVFSNNRKISFESIYARDLTTNEDKKLFNFANQIECNPVYSEEGDKKFISYIKSPELTEETLDNYNPLTDFSLYRVEIDNDFNVIGEHRLIAPGAYTGFENHKLLIYSFLQGSRIFLSITHKQSNNTSGVDITNVVGGVPMFRVIPVFEMENSIIITSARLEDSFLVADVNNFYNFKRLVNREKRKIYKCTFLEDLLVYAIKTGEDFEDRDLVFENGFVIQ